jgi:general secretion pathway protein E
MKRQKLEQRPKLKKKRVKKMITYDIYHNPHLELYEVDGIDIEKSIKNHLLFSKIDGTIYAITSEEHFTTAISFYSKYQYTYEIKIADDDSYTRLYNKFLSAKSGKAITEINKNDSAQPIDIEDDMPLGELLYRSDDILTSEESAPIIKFVNAMFYQAVEKRATDIHIDTLENSATIKYRVDGVLGDKIDVDKKNISLIINRVKVISNLDISENRLPQDGRTQIKIGKKSLDIRVSILPMFYGERVVMRLLMQDDDIPAIADLGFSHTMLDSIKKLLLHPHGIILVTGPTGSGKTTSLHAFLKHIYSPEKNIITVEDPVEYKSDNIAQLQVNDKIGLTFATALRSILRQDPDVLMIGEIRDEDTASIAIRSALTGHLVLSTLHTNSASATISRLLDMKVEPFLISSSILGIISQRLVRSLCKECKESSIIDNNIAAELNIPQNSTIYKPKGCKSCNYSGYHSRIAIAEVMIVDDDLRAFIKKNSDEHSIREYLLQSGLDTISTQLKRVLLNGDTSLDEAIRVGLIDV